MTMHTIHLSAEQSDTWLRTDSDGADFRRAQRKEALAAGAGAHVEIHNVDGIVLDAIDVPVEDAEARG